MSTSPSHSSRREFLEFFGRASVALTATSALPSTASLSLASLLISCETQAKTSKHATLPFAQLPPSTADELRLAKGFEFHTLISWGDPLNSKGDTFGYDNDYIAFFPLPGKAIDRTRDGVMWVNHEAVHPLFVSGWDRDPATRTKAQYEIERKSVGGTLMRVRKNKAGRWEVVK
ncbi:MAG: DUF839 domain-containing protein, partial [Bdellovibrionaceae bacterium]|nr:DUF839 domain-containing protein [Pseudobdellovibrionaceae bacterium]